MRMRTPFALGAALMGLAAAGIGSAAAAANVATRGLGEAIGPLRQRRGKGQNNRRGRGAVAKPRKRPNMRTVSKRARSKHRKAAKRG